MAYGEYVEGSSSEASGMAITKRAVSEAVGTGMLLVAIVGSGTMAERLTTDTAIALLANSLATGCALATLILTFGPISGGHFNPVVTLSDAWLGGHSWRDVPAYIAAQVAGAYGGVGIANAMFGLPLFFPSKHVRSGTALLLGETVATFGLLSVIWGCVSRRPAAAPFAVAAYITGAYWFTSSTSFANPAVTLARVATDTFSGIRATDVPGFIAAQLLGAALATALFKWLAPALNSRP
jgi:glycerol uptake facilitator-like aquaporin